MRSVSIAGRCDPDLFEFAVLGHECDEDHVMCTVLPDGSRQIRLLFPPPTHASVFSLYFSVQRGELNDATRSVQFGYDIHIEAG
ncbi:MAG: hypothetical protein ACNA8W_14650 [Bradymonadaceae bacterium]